MDARTRAAVERLLRSEEPAARWRVRAEVLGEDEDASSMRSLRSEIRACPRVRTILDASRGARVYAKWKGPHWALLSLASLGYPPGDVELHPLRDAVLDHWLAPRYLKDQDIAPGSTARSGVPRVEGLSRRCGSQQGGALRAIVALGIDDGRAEIVAARLQQWQWPDGGWNCDARPTTTMSSVNETLLPMRGLHAYADVARDEAAAAAARRAAEVLLTRRVAWRRSSPEPIAPDVMKIHHPVYWHYDFLAGLVGLGELGLLADRRCDDALDHLESRRLPDGSWAADAKYWRKAETGSNVESVTWGPTSARDTNEWVTWAALQVLASAGRL